MNALLISDLHLTSLARDEYRWRLFDWLVETMPKHDVRELFILGDLTDAKDFHSAKLVNRIVEQLLRCYRRGNLLGITIIRGNHDGVDPSCAYFKFLGEYPCITYVDKPTWQRHRNKDVLLLPHTRDPVNDWDQVELFVADFILMHATVRGSLAENGQALDGIPSALLSTGRRARIFSGDVHVPQEAGNVEYIGAPYPIKFGDQYQGRAVLLHNWGAVAQSLHIPSIQRLMLYADADGIDSRGAELHPSDQVKIRIRLSPSQYGDWQEIKRKAVKDCVALRVEVCGVELERESRQLPEQQREIKPVVSPERTLREFGKRSRLSPELIEEGTSLLSESLSSNGKGASK